MREMEVAHRLASLSTREIVGALGLDKRASIFGIAAALLARLPSARLGRQLARFDARVADVGLGWAAKETLASFGASFTVRGSCPSGPLLVVTNHPGAYDALALMAAIRRRDTYLVAADRSFLRAMPHVAQRLVFVPETGSVARARVLRDVLGLFREGALVIHFGAGAIEPEDALLDSWPAGTGALARAAIRASGNVLPAFVRGVHSPRAKRLPVVRWAERRGVTTLAPLVQATLPGFRDVAIEVAFGPGVDRDLLSRDLTDVERTERIRRAVDAVRISGDERGVKRDDARRP